MTKRKITIIDGYNVIYRMPELTAKLEESLEAARMALAMRMADWKRSHAGIEVYIVFDGRDSAPPNRSRVKLCGIDCVFTATKETADERIIGIVRSAKSPSDVTVISSDNCIRNSCNAHGAWVKDPATLEKRTRKVTRPVECENKVIDSEKTEKVTDFYENYLRDKGAI